MSEDGADSPQEAPVEKKGVTRREWLKAAGGGVISGFVPGLGNVNLAESKRRRTGEIIGEEELRTRFNTEIFDLPRDRFPDDYVELGFTRSAEQSVLFQGLESGRFKLRVILIDDFQVSTDKLTAEQRQYFQDKPAVLNSLKTELGRIKELSKEKIASEAPEKKVEYDKRLNELMDLRDLGKLTQDQYDVREQALDYQYEAYLVEGDNLSDDLLQRNGLRMFGTTQTLGTTKDGKPIQHVFMAVRDIPQVTFKSGDETYTIDAIVSDDILSIAPKPEDSYADPETLDVDYDSPEYMIGRLDAGIILRHELQHARGLLRERDADSEVIADLTKAYDMKEGGDDSGYWIVFDTPEGRMYAQNAYSQADRV